mmetsp:Transcript_24330/g.45675  ORF Transcript_24330/g.45675 Transcript_24330/m.45675 type:complete len:153 (+) Transcript_24330:59-517(+)
MPSPSVQPLLTSTLLLQNISQTVHESLQQGEAKQAKPPVDTSLSATASLKCLLKKLIQALETTKKLLDSSQVLGSSEPFDVDKYDRQILQPLDVLITSTLPPSLIQTLTSSYVLPLSPSSRSLLFSSVPSSLILSSIDPLIPLHSSKRPSRP